MRWNGHGPGTHAGFGCIPALSTMRQRSGITKHEECESMTGGPIKSPSLEKLKREFPESTPWLENDVRAAAQRAGYMAFMSGAN